MLSLWRKTGNGGRYRKSALVLLINGEVIGEVMILQARSNGFGGAQVQVGLTLPPEIEVVRADAIHRPAGPSLDWLLERERAFETGMPFTRYPTPVFKPVFEPVFEAVGPYADPDDQSDRAPEDVSDCASEDESDQAPKDESDEAPGWGAAPEQLEAWRRPEGTRSPAQERRPPAIAPTPQAPLALYAFRRVDPRADQRDDQGRR